jgi:hypothetical protein
MRISCRQAPLATIKTCQRSLTPSNNVRAKAPQHEDTDPVLFFVNGIHLDAMPDCLLHDHITGTLMQAEISKRHINR